MPIQKLTAEIVHAAIEGFESQKRRIDSQIEELRQLLNGDRTAVTSGSGAPNRKRKISAAGRRRMAAAQKARWAKIKREAEPGLSSNAPKPAKQKRKMSAAGRKAISEATKKRWAMKRAEAESKPIGGAKAAAKKAPGKKSAMKKQKTSEATASAAAQ